jgi:DNA-binding transcriptional ArsR family regulator
MDETRVEAPEAGELLPAVRGTRGVVLRLLRGCELTADELAARLGVTPNAARFHLAELERGGLVAQRAVRRGPRKPSNGYSLTARGEAVLSKCYDALLNAVLRDVRAEHPPGAVEALFRRLDRQLAAGGAPASPGGRPRRASPRRSACWGSWGAPPRTAASRSGRPSSAPAIQSTRCRPAGNRARSGGGPPPGAYALMAPGAFAGAGLGGPLLRSVMTSWP